MSTPSLFPSYPLEDYHLHAMEIDKALKKSLELGHYILGDEVSAFETEFASFVGCKHAIGVANGTDSIELLLRGLDIGAGNHVAVPSQTAVASVSAITRAGATPVFIDVEPDSFTISPACLEQVVKSSSGHQLKAVLAVHLYGHPADLTGLQEVCRKHDLILLEDCAQSHGAEYLGRKVGGIGRGGSFSFYPTKNLGAIGDGGAVTTDDSELAEKILCLRQYGWRDRYISAIEGVNSRLDELQAAILRVKLPHLTRSNDSRHRLAALYDARLAGLPLDTPRVAPGCRHVYHLYVIRTKERTALMKHLIAKGIPAALHYPAAVHQQPAYAHITAKSPPLPNTERLVKEILSLPLHPHLTEEAAEFTCAAVREFFHS